MLQTVTFHHSFLDDAQFDEDKNLISPGARELAEAVRSGLLHTVSDATPITQHSFFGWEFQASFDDCCMVHVFNPFEGECFLTLSLRGFFLKSLLLQHPRRTFDRYRTILNDVLERLPGVTEVSWNRDRS